MANPLKVPSQTAAETQTQFQLNLMTFQVESSADKDALHGNARQIKGGHKWHAVRKSW